MLKTVDRLVETQMEMSKYIGKRKHSSQLQGFEIESIWKRLKEIKNWRIKTHALDRLEEKGIQATYEDIVSTIYNANIIEYKINYLSLINRCDERVVLRSKAIVNREYNLHVVYSLTEGRVITVWINHVDDHHKTLDWSQYDENMKVFGI